MTQEASKSVKYTEVETILEAECITHGQGPAGVPLPPSYPSVIKNQTSFQDSELLRQVQDRDFFSPKRSIRGHTILYIPVQYACDAFTGVPLLWAPVNNYKTVSTGQVAQISSPESALCIKRASLCETIY